METNSVIAIALVAPATKVLVGSVLVFVAGFVLAIWPFENPLRMKNIIALLTIVSVGFLFREPHQRALAIGMGLGYICYLGKWFLKKRRDRSASYSTAR